jgi:hypothetical protein
MRGIISNSLLPKLQPRTKYYEIRDQKLKGFILRVQPSGDMYYRCEYARGKVISLGSTKILTSAQARDEARKILSQARLGIEPGDKNLNDPMILRKFVNDEYESWRLANRKNGKADLRRLKINFVSEMGDRLLSDITPILIEKWRTNRINNGIRIATVNRDIVILKSTLSKAIEWGFIKEHPLQNLRLHKVDSSAKIRYLFKDEEVRLKAAIEDRVKTSKMPAHAPMNGEKSGVSIFMMI